MVEAVVRFTAVRLAEGESHVNSWRFAKRKNFLEAVDLFERHWLSGRACTKFAE